jgi:hypothetical protein
MADKIQLWQIIFIRGRGFEKTLDSALKAEILLTNFCSALSEAKNYVIDLFSLAQ